MGEPWATKKDLEKALRNIHLRLESLAAGGGEENMVYNTAASHTHSGGATYETVLNISGEGQAQIFMTHPKSNGYHDLKITVDGTVVLTDCRAQTHSYAGDIVNMGAWNFETSLKIEHKSDLATPVVRVAYCCA